MKPKGFQETLAGLAADIWQALEAASDSDSGQLQPATQPNSNTQIHPLRNTHGAAAAAQPNMDVPGRLLRSAGAAARAGAASHDRASQPGRLPHGTGSAVTAAAATAQPGRAEETGGQAAEEDDYSNLQWNPVACLQSAPAAEHDSKAVELHKDVTLDAEGRVVPRDRRTLQKAATQGKKVTAGKAWFDLPATPLTDDVKRDLRLLRLRNAFDPKRHYKSLDAKNKKGFPRYFQFGTVVEGPGEFFSGRLSKKERKPTFAEQLLADSELTAHRQKKYAEYQAEAAQWSKYRKKRRTAAKSRR